MAYYQGSVTLNLNAINSTAFPTTGGSKTCKLGSTSAPSAPSYKVTVDNSEGGALMGGTVRIYSSSGTKLIERTTRGTESKTVSGTAGTVSQTASNYYYNGTRIYYDVSTTNGSNPVVYAQVVSPGTSGTDYDGNTYYKSGYLYHNGTLVALWGGTDITTYSKSANITLTADATFTLSTTTSSVKDGYLEMDLSLSSKNSSDYDATWKNSSGSAKTLSSASGNTDITYWCNGGSQSSFSFTGSSWSGSRTATSGAYGVCFTKLTRSTTDLTVSCYKTKVLTSILRIRATAYSDK